MKKEEKKTSDNSFGVAAVILGILSILTLSVEGFVLGLISFVFASKQMKKNSNQWTKWGKILSIVGIVLSIVTIIVAIILFSKNPELLKAFPNFPQ